MTTADPLWPCLDRRVHISFSGTAYQLSRCQYYTFGILAPINIIAPICLASAMDSEGNVTVAIQAGSLILLILVISWCSLYPILVIVATCIFERNLLAVAKLQAASTADVTKMVELTDRQQTLIAVAAYVLYTVYCCLHGY